MKWLSNTYNPKDKNAKMYVAQMHNETQEEAWKHHTEWLKGKHIGRPHASEVYTVEQLEEMGMVGVYDNNEIMLSGKDAKEFLAALLGKE